jgi:hypothetical protein
MQFILAKDGWTVSFLEEDCKTFLPRHFIFQGELKILDLARHGCAEFNLAGPSGRFSNFSGIRNNFSPRLE